MINFSLFFQEKLSRWIEFPSAEQIIIATNLLMEEGLLTCEGVVGVHQKFQLEMQFLPSLAQ